MNVSQNITFFELLWSMRTQWTFFPIIMTESIMASSHREQSHDDPYKLLTYFFLTDLITPPPANPLAMVLKSPKIWTFYDCMWPLLEVDLCLLSCVWPPCSFIATLYSPNEPTVSLTNNNIQYHTLMLDENCTERKCKCFATFVSSIMQNMGRCVTHP